MTHDDRVVGYNIDWESWATYLLHTHVYGDSHWLECGAVTGVQNEVNLVVLLVNFCEPARRPDPEDRVILAEV